MSIKKENLKFIRKTKFKFPRPPLNHKWDKHIRHEQEDSSKYPIENHSRK